MRALGCHGNVVDRSFLSDQRSAPHTWDLLCPRHYVCWWVGPEGRAGGEGQEEEKRLGRFKEVEEELPGGEQDRLHGIISSPWELLNIVQETKTKSIEVPRSVFGAWQCSFSDLVAFDHICSYILRGFFILLQFKVEIFLSGWGGWSYSDSRFIAHGLSSSVHTSPFLLGLVFLMML